MLVGWIIILFIDPGNPGINIKIVQFTISLSVYFPDTLLQEVIPLIVRSRTLNFFLEQNQIYRMSKYERKSFGVYILFM